MKVWLMCGQRERTGKGRRRSERRASGVDAASWGKWREGVEMIVDRVKTSKV
jgi:ribosomal protein L25 (general stress protein Ctc)